MRYALSAPFTTALLLMTGCSLEPLALEGACPDSHRDRSGPCCPVWEAPDGAECAPREWVLPGADGGLGNAGARELNVAVDGLGRPAATWIEPGDSGDRTIVAEPDGGGFSLRSPSAGLGGSSVQSDIAAGPDGALLVGWKQRYPGDQHRIFKSERGPGEPWVDPSDDEQLISALPTAYEPRPRIFANGERLIVWNQWMSTGYGVALARRPPGGDWRLPKDADDVLSVHILYSNAPQPAVNAAGDALITWYQSVGGALLAWKSERFGYDGAFSRPAIDEHLSISDTPIDSHSVANTKPALSASGEAAIAWTQENGKGSVLVYMATRTPEGVWTKPASLDDALSPRLGYARCVQIAFAKAGDLFVVWYQDTGGGHRVLAAHRSPDGQWVEPGREPVTLSSPGAEAVFPTLAVGEAGGVLVAWSERRGDTWVVAARRRGPTGTEWGPVEVLSDSGGGPALQPVAAIGGPGDSAIVGWIQGAGQGEKALFATIP
jgi:hypothetical protein